MTARALGGLAGLLLATAAAAEAPLPDLHWRSIGPSRGGWGEMVEGIPSRPDSFWFGAAGGGVWRTDDAGRTWRSVFDHGPSAPIGALAIAPSAPDTVYIGAGQPEPRYDVAGGSGVFRTDDGGRTWRSLGLASSRAIGRILVHPRDRERVLVAALGDFFSSGGERGVFRSDDGGRSWRRTLDLGPNAGAIDLAADPADPNVVFAAAWQARQYPWQSYFTPVAGPASGIYKSVDGGATWSRVAGGGWPAGDLGRISLATTRTPAGLRVYAVASSETAGGLWRSDDGGASWARVNDEQAFTSYYASRVTVAPNDPDTVYLVGQSIRRCGRGGKTCVIVKGAPGGDDYHHVWINPARPDHIATASDQGVVVSVNGGATWSSWYNQPTGQFYHMAADTGFPYRIYSGQQDSGTVAAASRSDFGALTFRDWSPVGGDERDYDIPDPDDPEVVYGSGLGGRVSRFDARTGQSANIAPFLEPNYGRRQTTTAHHFVWVTPLAVSRVGPTTLYLGAESVFASTDKGANWRLISPDLTGKMAGAPRCDGEVAVADAKACGYGGIWSLAPSPRHAGELWVGADDGLVHLTRDGGASWSDVTPRGLPDWAKIASIDPSPLADGGALVAVDSHRLGDLKPRLLATSDYGRSWRDITGDLPRDHPAFVVRADTERPGLLFAGTEVGAYVSLDFGTRWRKLADLPTAQVNDLLVHGDDLIAATQGRGLYVLDDIAPLRQWRGDFDRAPVRLFDPAPAIRVRDNNNHDTPLPADEPMAANPPAGAVIDYWLGRSAKGPVVLEIRDARGALVRRLASVPPVRPLAEVYFADAWIRPDPGLPAGAGMHRVVWDLHYERPRALAWDFSIAATPGRDTPIVPQGPLAPPGRYSLRLIVDGRAYEATLVLSQDPRTHVSEADFAASLGLSREIAAALDIAWRGDAQQRAAHAALAALGETANDPAAAALVAATKPPKSGGFGDPAGVLAAIETDLESADLAPTAPQRAAVAEARTHIEAAMAGWARLRDGDLAAFNVARKARGAAPVFIPPDDALSPASPAGGEDLP